jgi:hypothetical protein
MPLWLFEILIWAMLSVGIILTHCLFLITQFLKESQGYMWRAAKKIWAFLFLFFIIELLISGFFFYAINIGVSYTSFPTYILAVLIGVLAASTPIVLEQVALPKSGTTVAALKKPLAKLLLKLNVTLRYNFAWSIESCREQDLFDCQLPNAWGLGLSPTVLSRRIRILYEIGKADIAKSRGDTSLLKYDVNRNSWEKFYLLVRHLGRKQLRNYLTNPPEAPCIGWDGSERRRRIGTLDNRTHNDESRDSLCRSYDSLTLT